MIKFDQIYNPLLKLLSVGGSTPKKRKKSMKYKVTAKAGTVVSNHYTKRAAVKQAKKVKGYYSLIRGGSRTAGKTRRVYSGYGNVGTSTRKKKKRYVYKSAGTF